MIEILLKIVQINWYLTKWAKLLPMVVAQFTPLLFLTETIETSIACDWQHYIISEDLLFFTFIQFFSKV